MNMNTKPMTVKDAKIALARAEADLAAAKYRHMIEQLPSTDPRRQGSTVVGVPDGYAKGWRRAALWANRDDLIADIGSPAYERDKAADLHASAEQGGSVVSPQMDNAAACTPMMEQGGRVDEADIEAMRSASMEIKHNKEPWFPMTDRRLRRAAEALLARRAALAQNAQGSETIWCMQCAKDTSYSECDNCPGNPGASRADTLAQDAQVDSNGCYTEPDGSCSSAGPCIHSPEYAQNAQGEADEYQQRYNLVGHGWSAWENIPRKEYERILSVITDPKKITNIQVRKLYLHPERPLSEIMDAVRRHGGKMTNTEILSALAANPARGQRP